MRSLRSTFRRGYCKAACAPVKSSITTISTARSAAFSKNRPSICCASCCCEPSIVSLCPSYEPAAPRWRRPLSIRNQDTVPFLKRTAAIAQALDLGLEVVPTRGIDSGALERVARELGGEILHESVDPSHHARRCIARLARRVAERTNRDETRQRSASVRSFHRRHGPDVSRRKSGALAVLADCRRSASRRLRQAHRLSRGSGRRGQDVRDARSRASTQGRRRRRRSSASSKRTAEKRPPRCSRVSKSFRREP